MTPQQKSFELCMLRVWSKKLYCEIIEEYKKIIQGENTEYKQKHFPNHDRQWFIDVLWECGEH